MKEQKERKLTDKEKARIERLNDTTSKLENEGYVR